MRYEAICGCGATLKGDSCNGAIWWACQECHARYDEATTKPPRAIECGQPGNRGIHMAPLEGDAGEWREIAEPKSKAEHIIDAIYKIHRGKRHNLTFLVSKADIDEMEDVLGCAGRPSGPARYKNAQICGFPAICYDAEGE